MNSFQQGTVSISYYLLGGWSIKEFKGIIIVWKLLNKEDRSGKQLAGLPEYIWDKGVHSLLWLQPVSYARTVHALLLEEQ